MDDIDQVARDFATLFLRPQNYFNLSDAEQWRIDRSLGALDIFIEAHEITDEMAAEWFTKFNRKLAR
jgi:hypothetical protein